MTLEFFCEILRIQICINRITYPDPGGHLITDPPEPDRIQPNTGENYSNSPRRILGQRPGRWGCNPYSAAAVDLNKNRSLEREQIHYEGKWLFWALKWQRAKREPFELKKVWRSIGSFIGTSPNWKRMSKQYTPDILVYRYGSVHHSTRYNQAVG